MLSRVFVTREVDDLKRAAAELTADINDELLQCRDLCGILFCFSDMDHEELLRLVRARFPYEIIGCTCIANMDGAEGFHEMAASFTVLAANDCAFGIAASGPVTPENVTDEVGRTFAAARAKLPEEGGDPGLVIALPPYNLSIMLDAFTAAFNEAAPGVPFIGGLPSHNGKGDRNLTLSRDGASEDRLVMLLIQGNVKPVFSLQNVSGNPVERKRKVTRSKDNVVYTVGSQTFVEYLKEVGVGVDRMLDGNATISFVSNPLLLENVSIGGQSSYSFVRTLHKIDPVDGSGTAIGEIPMDATLSICSLQAGQITEGAERGVSDLLRKMEEAAPYAFSTVLAVSCIGRYLLMVPNNSAEVDTFLHKIPSGISLNGFYSYGEIAPIAGGNGRLLNFAHNESLVLCAF